MRNPRSFFEPLAIGAPEPLREIPVRPSRMIHFLDFSNEKMVGKAADIATKTDILLGNLEDAIPVDRKEAAREGLIKVGKEIELGETQLWTRVNALESPWVLDDLTQIVEAIGHKLDVVMVPKVEGPWDIHYVDRLLAQLEARAELKRPILVHAILETAQGVANVEEIATASPRMQGHEPRSGRPRRLATDEDDPRRRRPPRLPRARRSERRADLAPSRTSGTTRSAAWSTPAPAPASCRSTARSATSATSRAARPSSAPPT